MRQLNGKKLLDQPYIFDYVFYSDASDQGFGSYVLSHNTQSGLSWTMGS